MKVVYIAGPYRAANNWEIEQNIRRAETLALEVWRAGFACICPHSNTRFYQGAAEDKVWLEGDIEIMLRCDAVLMTPDWEKSSGARAERETALMHDIPVFYSLERLVNWMRATPSREFNMPPVVAGKRKHVLYTQHTCPCRPDRMHDCPVCDGGLAICSLCGQAEAELEPSCPGPRTTNPLAGAILKTEPPGTIFTTPHAMGGAV